MIEFLAKLRGTTADAVIIFVLVIAGFYRHPIFDFWTITSGLLFISGGILGLTARYQLGKSFSVTPKAKKIVSHGIYSKIRHPIYLAGIIINIGFCLLYKNWIFYTLLVLLIIIQIARASKEEKILAKTFGQEYIEYKKSTWF